MDHPYLTVLNFMGNSIGQKELTQILRYQSFHFVKF